ncbi:MAG: molecular chaperone DnaJ [Myxococcota bacterium]
MKRDYYEVLGVDRGASPEELKRAYRKRAHRDHPDKNPGDSEAEARFKEASEAYAVLSDPEKRAAYDRFGHAGIAGGGAGGDPFAGFDPFSSFSDLFNEFFGGDLFGGRRRGGGQRGADLRYDLEVDFEVAARGGEHTVTVPKHRPCESCAGLGGERETCSRCGGRGQVLLQQGFFRISRPCDACRGSGAALRHACETCGGRGRVETVQKVKVRIPPGVESGVRLRLSGEGEAGYDGGPSGDLYVVLRVRDHPIFRREGTDLYCELPVSFAHAALGAEVEVPTLEARETLRIRPGTQSGERIRLRGRGLPRLGGGPRGDQIVEVFVEVPTRLSAEQRELLERFAEASGDEAHPVRRGFLDKLRELFD